MKADTGGTQNSEHDELVNFARTMLLICALCVLMTVTGCLYYQTQMHHERHSHAPVPFAKFTHIDFPGREPGGVVCSRNTSNEDFACMHPNTWSQKIPLFMSGSKSAVPYMFCESTVLSDGSRIVWPATCYLRLETGCSPERRAGLFSPFRELRTNYEVYCVILGGVATLCIFVFIDFAANGIATSSQFFYKHFRWILSIARITID